MRKEGKGTFETCEGPVTFELTQLNGLESALLIVELVQKHGPAVGKISAAMNADGSLKLAALGEAVNAISQSLNPKDFENLLFRLVKGAQASVNGEFVDVDRALISTLFTGHPMGVFELFTLGITTNYEDFFGAVAKLIPAPKTAKPTKDPKKATQAEE